MTSRNLATIFGPNLLHKQKNSNKEFAVQNFARAEQSTAIISVVQRMIDSYDKLFMVSCFHYKLQHVKLTQNTTHHMQDVTVKKKLKSDVIRLFVKFSTPFSLFWINMYLMFVVNF